MSGFAHPCALVNVTCMKVWKTADTSPQFKHAFDKLSKVSPLNYKPTPLAKIDIGAYGAGMGHKEFISDAEQAVQQAVMFCITGKSEYAENAVTILRAWSTQCVSFEGSNAPLELGWGVCSLARCAEILKHTYDKWTACNIERVFNTFLDTIALPKLRIKLSWTNNWQTTICEARLQIAIFRDDAKEVEWAINEFKRILSVYVLNNGQTQETLRDLVHAQFGIGGLLQIPELVYVYTHGKVDLFAPILHSVCEFHAQLLLGMIPQGSGLKKEQIKDPWFLPCGWEIAVHHFEVRKKMPMPRTKELLEKHRPESYVFHWGLGTLTHYCMPFLSDKDR